jgi:CspA family cold shock protein
MYSEGRVREWDDDQGTGVIDSADTPGGCWVSFSSLVMEGFHSLSAGDPVTFTFETGPQDGLDYRAVLVWPPGVEPGTPGPEGERRRPSAAYRSSLTIHMPGRSQRPMPGS